MGTAYVVIAKTEKQRPDLRIDFRDGGEHIQLEMSGKIFTNF
jgi:hypothetical protein